MWIQISSGKGPDECELAVNLFLEAYQKECNSKGIKTNIIDFALGNIPGNLKSALLSVDCSEEDIQKEMKRTHRRIKKRCGNSTIPLKGVIPSEPMRGKNISPKWILDN